MGWRLPAGVQNKSGRAGLFIDAARGGWRRGHFDKPAFLGQVGGRGSGAAYDCLTYALRVEDAKRIPSARRAYVAKRKIGFSDVYIRYHDGSAFVTQLVLTRRQVGRKGAVGCNRGEKYVAGYPVLKVKLSSRDRAAAGGQAPRNGRCAGCAQCRKHEEGCGQKPKNS